MRNSDYWRQRFEAIEEQAHEKAAEYIGNADTQYRRAMHSLQRDINNWYARFAQNNQISMTEARKLLSSKELEELKWTVEDYIRHGEQLHLHPEWMKQLENASARYHISRLEALRLQVRQQAEILHGNQAEGMEKLLQNILSDGYDHTAFEIQKGIGVGWNVHSIDKRRIDQLLKQPWTTDERTFRDRCWTNKAELVNTVNNVMTQGIIRGDAPEKMITAITDCFDVARNKAARLVYTESAYFSAKAQESCYDDLGVDNVQVLETLDSRTCPSCGSLDGTVVSRKDYEPGVTVPPFHPGCRGTTCPYFDDMDDGQRIARKAEGETYHVPANTTYEQWKEMQENDGKLAMSKIRFEDSPLSTAKITKHTEEELKEIKRYALSKGVAIRQIESFDGDIEVLRDQIDAINEIRVDYGLNTSKPTKITFSDLDPGVFAVTNPKGKIIEFDRAALRDREITNAELNKDNWLSTTDVKGIAYHEMGHVLSKTYGEKGLEIAQKTYYNLYREDLGVFGVLEYLGKNVSGYSIDIPESEDETGSHRFSYKKYKEIIPELLSKHLTNPSPFSEEFIRLLREAYKL